jgi:WD40 repeat protein
MPAHYVPLKNDSTIELSHESLMRIWNKLDVWVEEEFESATMYKRLSDAASMYQIGKTGLWRPPDLQLALNWQKKQRPTREWAQRYDPAFERAIVFLDTSRITYEAELKNQEMLQKRVLRRARATAIILGIAALIAMLFFFFGYLQKIESDKQTDLARAGQVEAEKQRIAAEKAQLTAKYQQEQAVKAKDEAIKLNDQLKSILGQLQIERDKALSALTEAKRQELIAKAAGEKEKIANAEAQVQTQKAESNYKKAQTALMLIKAQEMAAKSVAEDDDKNLSGLLAMQAFIFHRRYEGKQYDPYIYSGLYHSLSLLSGVSYNAIKVKGPARNRMNSVAVSSKSAQFYVAAADGRIFSGNYETLKGQTTGFENPYPNRIVALSKDENYLVNGTDSAAVQIFDLKNTKAKPLVVKSLSGASNDIEFLPDNSGFVVSKSDKTISIINHLTGKVSPLVSLPFELKSISVSPDGKLVAGGTWSGDLVLIDLQSKKAEVVYKDSAAQILTVRFSPDGKKLAYGTYEIKEKRGLVKMFDMTTRTKDERQLTGHKAGIYDIEFSPDGKLLASAGSDKRLQMWVLDHPEDLPIVMDNNNGFIWDIAFAKGSDYLIAACHESEIRVWPTDPELLAKQVCPRLARNMTLEEWSRYVASDIEFENTCTNILIKDYE